MNIHSENTLSQSRTVSRLLYSWTQRRQGKMLGRSIHKVRADSVWISLFSDELFCKTGEAGSDEGEEWWVLFVLFNTFTMISSIIDSV